MPIQRFTFRYFCPDLYQTREITIVGRDYFSARTGAWDLLAQEVGARDVKERWRIVSTIQCPAEMVMRG